LTLAWDSGGGEEPCYHVSWRMGICMPYEMPYVCVKGCQVIVMLPMMMMMMTMMLIRSLSVCVCMYRGRRESKRANFLLFLYLLHFHAKRANQFNCIPSQRVVELASHVRFGGKPLGGFTRRSSISHTRMPTCTAPLNHAFHTHTRKSSEEGGGASNNTG